MLKEFTFEIEQLKKDLLAAREKNGIYLSQERHDDMVQTLAAQKNEIEELTVMMQVGCSPDLT